MPMYSYKCKDCDNTVDKIVKLDDRDKSFECNKCGGEMQHVPFTTGGAVVFKGKWFKNSGGY